MSAWEKVRLGEVADCALGKMLDHRKNHGKPLPYLANYNVRWGDFDLNEVFTMPFEESEIERYSVKSGDLLICEGGEIGRCALWKDHEKVMMYQKALHRVRTDSEKCLSEYLFYWFLNAGKINFFRQFSSGATILHLPREKLINIKIDLPPLPIQRRIASILSDYDAAIANCRRQIALLEEAAQRLYREWFAEGKGEKGPISKLVNFQSGYAFKSSLFIEKGKFGVVTIKHVQDGVFSHESMDRVLEVPLGMPEHCRLHVGDILMSLTGNVGRVCVVDDEGFLLNQRVAKLKTPYPVFVYCMFRSREMMKNVINIAHGAAQQNLSPIRLGEEKIIVPNQEDIIRFENLVAPMFDLRLSLSRQIRTLTEARDRLLPKLMSGEVAV